MAFHSHSVFSSARTHTADEYSMGKSAYAVCPLGVRAGPRCESLRGYNISKPKQKYGAEVDTYTEWQRPVMRVQSIIAGADPCMKLAAGQRGCRCHTARPASSFATELMRARGLTPSELANDEKW